VGKALAYPDSLTTDEIHEACGWPRPDVIRANIQRATSSRLSTPAEPYAKDKSGLDYGQFDLISDDKAWLIAHCFYAQDDYPPSSRKEGLEIPGLDRPVHYYRAALGWTLRSVKLAYHTGSKL
jgi:hypothetical protein